MKKFMVVDDSLFQRKNLSKMITQLGGEVVAEAANGKEAVDLYPRSTPDIVFMDLMMPEMEGTEAVKRIMEIDRKATIVVISSIGHDDIVKQALSLGAKQFLTKPVNFGQVESVVSSLTGGH